MVKFVLALLMIFAPGDVTETLDRAESLYFEAKFKEALQVLQQADEMLRSGTDGVPDKIHAKLLLALVHVGLNDGVQAKAALREVYALDPGYSLDSSLYPPKIISLSDQAKVEQAEIRCRNLQTDASKHLESANASALVDLIQSMKSKCSALGAMEPEAAQLLYKSAVDLYKAGRYSEALGQFQTVVKLAPAHELALEYIDLTHSKAQVQADRVFLDWSKMLETRQFKQAALRFAELSALPNDVTAETLVRMRTDYRNALSALVELWNRACASSDAVAMASIKAQLPDSLPESLSAADILGQMKACTKRGCMPIGPTLALARVKVHVPPVISKAVLDSTHLTQVTTVRVKIRIDENGDAVALDAQGGAPAINDVVKAAVGRWKFATIVDDYGPRCSETEIPITIRP